MAGAYTDFQRQHHRAHIAILGQETAGALRILRGSPLPTAEETMRRVTPDEIAARIRERPQLPFTIWDRKVRLSIAGYQDKIAVLKSPDDETNNWFLVEGGQKASTHILKPEPVSPGLPAWFPTSSLYAAGQSGWLVRC